MNERDAKRWRFIADNRLTVHTAGDEVRVNLVQKGEPPKIMPVAVGSTPDEAVDAAIARYERGLGEYQHFRRPRKQY